MLGVEYTHKCQLKQIRLTDLFTCGFPHCEMKGKCVFLCMNINGNLHSM